MMCMFTRYPVAVPIRNKKAETVANAIMGRWISPFGIPESVLTDRGGEFVNKGLEYIARKMGIHKITTSGRLPWANGAIEKFHSLMNASLSIMSKNDVPNWEFYLSVVLFSFRVTINLSTSYSPYELMFGRSPILPLDVVYGLDSKVKCSSTHDYAAKRVEWLKQ